MKGWICLSILLMLFSFSPTSLRAENSSTPTAATEAKASPQHPSRLTETEKIEALLKKVAEAKDLVFIRNGKEHSSAEAVKHLRRKWNYKKEDIRTARQFIALLASRSSTTGKPYHIRDADGKQVEAGVWFMRTLASIEEASHETETEAPTEPKK